MKSVEPLDDSEDDRALTQQRAAAASQSTWVSIVVNICLTGTQVVMGILSGFQGLVADGLHSLSDLIADFVVLFATRCQSSSPAPGRYAHVDHGYAATVHKAQGVTGDRT